MKIPRHWLCALAFIAVVWLTVAAVMRLTEDQVSSPGKVLDLMARAPWLSGGGAATVSPAARQDFIDRVVENLNRLDFEQRRQLREEDGGVPQKFFDSLTREEQSSYIDRTVQKHFDAVIKGFKAMSPEDRKQMMARVRRDIRAFRGGDPAGAARSEDDQKLFDDFFDIGVEDYLKNATTEEKMKLAPVIEDLHSRMQGFGR